MSAAAATQCQTASSVIVDDHDEVKLIYVVRCRYSPPSPVCRVAAMTCVVTSRRPAKRRHNLVVVLSSHDVRVLTTNMYDELTYRPPSMPAHTLEPAIVLAQRRLLMNS